ncbi:unnamed protein product, partial [Rotaria sp. Silwood1]
SGDEHDVRKHDIRKHDVRKHDIRKHDVRKHADVRPEQRCYHRSKEHSPSNEAQVPNSQCCDNASLVALSRVIRCVAIGFFLGKFG